MSPRSEVEAHRPRKENESRGKIILRSKKWEKTVFYRRSENSFPKEFSLHLERLQQMNSLEYVQYR